MTALCSEVRGRFEGYLAEALSAGERRSVREHLSGCAACRGEAASWDPALLFAATPADEVSPEETARILSAVRSGIAWKQTERRLSTSQSGRRARVAASVAAVAALVLALPGGRVRDEGRRSASAARHAGKAPEGRPGRLTPLAAPPVRSTFPADATMYDWNPGGGEPRVVWIVDRSLDI